MLRLKRGWCFIEDHNWWTTHIPVSMNVGRLNVGLKYEAIGGMAPWREIWNGSGTGVVEFGE